MPLTPTLVVVGLLLIFTAFLCAVETALLACSKARMHEYARHGDPRAVITLQLIKQIDEVLVAILIILTIVPVTCSALVTSATLTHFGAQAVAYSTAILGVTIIFVAEAFPKALGTRFPNPIALVCARPLWWCMKIMFPITWTIKQVNDGVLAALGLSSKNANTFTEADLRGAISLGLENGTVGETQHHMLDAVLDLNNLSVADVMVHRSAIVSFDVNTKPKDIPATLGNLRHSRVVVYDGEPENIIGILYVRDYLTALAMVENRTQVKLRDHLRPLYFVPDTTPVGHQLIEFLRLHRHLALVVDEYGDIQGLITLEDILEEIVGDITDEHDGPPSDILETEGNGTLLLRASMPVRNANRQFGWSLPEDSAITLAGLIVETLGHLPSQGESTVISGITFHIAAKRGHRIERIRAVPPEPTPEHE